MPDVSSARPWIVQEKLAYPEMRIFRVGRHYFAFSITSPDIDYRNSDDFTLVEVEPPQEQVEALQRLTDLLGLDYAAADFKTHPQTGRLMFLEVNTMPMFTAYDDAAQGRLSDALALFLRGGAFSPKAAAKPAGPSL
jgi:glutathione synthase/RimK-type ligase-like ATP-grasp enzyme